MTDDERCPRSLAGDDQHCRHWWDGEPCHWCDAPAMSRAQKIEQGMIEPMRPATGDMPARERMVREFLARYRCPSPDGWQEHHVAHALSRMAVLP